MNELPLEIKFIILNKLTINELLNLRLISKYWKSIVNNFWLNELIYKDIKNEFDKKEKNQVWFHTNRPLDNFIFILQHNNPNYGLINSSALTINKLRRFKIDFTFANHEFDIEIVNLFTNLEQLELNGIVSDDNEKIIQLNNLQILYFDIVHFGYLNLVTPKLKVFCSLLKNLDKINLYYHETIRTLILPSFNMNVIKFSNLNCIKLIHTYENSKSIDRLKMIYNTAFKSILIHLSKLKELHIECQNIALFDIENFCKLLINEKISLGIDLDIYYLNKLVYNHGEIQSIHLNAFTEVLKHFCPFF